MSGTQATREQRRQVQRDDDKLPRHLEKVPEDKWPVFSVDLKGGRLWPGPVEVWRSRGFLVQVYQEALPVLVRISVNRTTLDAGCWTAEITWDELQQIKAEVGYPMHGAVEVYSRATDVVNVANLMHLWVMAKPLEFGWRR